MAKTRLCKKRKIRKDGKGDTFGTIGIEKISIINKKKK